MSGRAIAIVGAGPAGFYAAESLAKKLPDCRIDIVERLPCPFGLVRGGVAPDHPGTKTVIRQFERTLQRPNVAFFGNVELGRDVSAAELAEHYDATMICTGAPCDRRLDIPGEDLPGVFGSARFVSWYNAIACEPRPAPELAGNAAVILGQGNVAADIARILARSPEELAATDISAAALSMLERARLTDLYLVGRRSAHWASFSALELGELGALARAEPRVDPLDVETDLPEDMPEERRAAARRTLEILRDFALRTPAGKPVRLHFVFNARPAAVLGSDHAEGIRLERTRTQGGRAVATGSFLEIAAGLIVTAIGYRSRPIPGIPFDEQRGTVRNDGGRVGPGVYAAGWCRRGPQGVIPANRADALEVAELVAADLRALAGQPAKPGRVALESMLRERGVRVVDAAGWKRIDAAEIARGRPLKPREKFLTVEEMLDAAAIP
ncbi:MAG: FAD-dependent oxidoreductase [Rhodocyclaceae bacterium]